MTDVTNENCQNKDKNVKQQKKDGEEGDLEDDEVPVDNKKLVPVVKYGTSNVLHKVLHSQSFMT